MKYVLMIAFMLSLTGCTLSPQTAGKKQALKLQGTKKVKFNSQRIKSARSIRRQRVLKEQAQGRARRQARYDRTKGRRERIRRAFLHQAKSFQNWARNTRKKSLTTR